jgi:hypothetical protein
MIALSPGMRRPTSRAPGLALLLCAGVAMGTSSGCSFLFVDGPPDNARKMRSFSCTTSNALPTTDVVLGSLMVIDAIGIAADPTYSSSGSGSGTNYGPAIGAAAVAAAFATSAAVGYKRTSECRDATAELMNRLYPPAPPGFAPAPYAPYPGAPPPPYDPWTAPAPGAAPPPGMPPPYAPPVNPGPWGAPPPPAAPPPQAPAPGPAPPPAPPPAGP